MIKFCEFKVVTACISDTTTKGATRWETISPPEELANRSQRVLLPITITIGSVNILSTRRCFIFRGTTCLHPNLRLCQREYNWCFSIIQSLGFQCSLKNISAQLIFDEFGDYYLLIELVAKKTSQKLL